MSGGKGNNWWWKWFGLKEIEFYSDLDCKQRIPTDKSRMAAGKPSLSGKQAGDEQSAFDGKTATEISPTVGTGHIIWIQYEWPQPVRVQCVRVLSTCYDGDTAKADCNVYLEAGNLPDELPKAENIYGPYTFHTDKWMQEKVTPRALPTLLPAAPVAVTEKEMGKTVAGEFVWHTSHQGINMKDTLVPRRSYTAACDAKALLAVAWTEGIEYVKDYGWKTTAGHITVYKRKSDGTFDEVETWRYSECSTMYDIDYTKDCSKLYAMCRGMPGMSGATDLIDPVMTKFNLPEDYIKPVYKDPKSTKQVNYLYLYRFNDGSVKSSPDKYVIHKGIGQWELGNNLMELSKDDSKLTYIAKAYMCGHPSATTDDCHEKESMYTILTGTMEIDYKNWGDYWTCGAGHTLFMRLAYNPDLDNWAETCGTDLAGEPYKFKAFSIFSNLARKDTNNAILMSLYDCEGTNWQAGGPGPLVPIGAEGWLATIVTSKNLRKDGCTAKSDQPTSIGVIKIGPDGKRIGDIKWVVSDPKIRMGMPNLAKLCDGRFLLGWGELIGTYTAETGLDGRVPKIVPHNYRMAEIDADGKILKGPWEVYNGGWGENDAWAVLNGKPVWVYTWEETPTIGPYFDLFYGAKTYEATGSTKLRIQEYSPGGPCTCTPGDFGGAIVAAINTHRTAAKASMVKVSWSSALAQQASNYAKQCKRTRLQSFKDRLGMGGFALVNQLVFISTDAAKYCPGAMGGQSLVNMWGEQGTDFDYNTGCKVTTDCSAYTQVVWEATNYVGCGHADCNGAMQWICNFAEGGNLRGEKPY